MLYNGKKFHLRTYYIITSGGNAFLCNASELIVAKKEYKEGEYKNKDIHDTHGVPEYIFSDESHRGFDDEQYNKMKKDIIKLHKKFISKIGIKCYFDVNFCFQIFGADIMFTADNEIKVLELNYTPGMADFDSNYLLEGIMQEIVDKKFPPKIKQPKNNNLIKLN